MARVATELLVAGTFEGLLNDARFTIAGRGAELVELRRHHTVATEGFALVFALEAELEQGMHHVEHPALGGVDLFLVPIGPRRSEAVINRLVRE